MTSQSVDMKSEPQITSGNDESNIVTSGDDE